jgi:hypothetical protein
MNIKIKDKVTVQYPGGMRTGGVVLSIIQVQGKEPEYVVVFEQIYGTHGHFSPSQIIAHVPVSA